MRCAINVSLKQVDARILRERTSYACVIEHDGSFTFDLRRFSHAVPPSREQHVTSIHSLHQSPRKYTTHHDYAACLFSAMYHVPQPDMQSSVTGHVTFFSALRRYFFACHMSALKRVTDCACMHHFNVDSLLLHGKFGIQNIVLPPPTNQAGK